MFTEDDDGIRIDQFPKYNDYQDKYVWKLLPGNKLTLQLNEVSVLTRTIS